MAPFDLLEHLEKNGVFDLYLLDMLMPGMTGIELARRIRERGDPAAILFLTTSREYAVEAFGVHAAGYLIKPVTQEAFDQAAIDAIEALSTKENPTLLLKTREGVRRVLQKSIVVIESFDHNRVCTSIDGTVVETAEKLATLTERLEGSPCFFAPHRAYIVNLQYVKGIQGLDLWLTNGKRIPVARRLLPALKNAYIKCDF